MSVAGPIPHPGGRRETIGARSQGQGRERLQSVRIEQEESLSYQPPLPAFQCFSQHRPSVNHFCAELFPVA